MSEKNPLWYELPEQRWQERRSDGSRIWSDSQKEKLYRAERAFRRQNDSRIKKFSTLREAQAYADEFIASGWVTQRFEKQEPVKLEARSGTFCDANQVYRRIRLASWGMNEVVLLHELSHILLPNAAGNPHGRGFARILLESVGHLLGSGAKTALRKLYVQNHVKSTPKPVYSEETKAKMRAQGLKMAEKLGWGQQ